MTELSARWTLPLGAMAEQWSRFIGSSDPATVARALVELGQTGERIGVLVGERDAAGIDALVAALAATGVEFFGGVFPELLVGRERHRSGTLLLRLRGLGPPIVLRDLTSCGAELRSLTTTLAAHRSGRPTALVLVDGLASGISRCLESVYGVCGTRVGYWGGGAGVSTLTPGPCLFTREGPFEHGAIVALSALEAQLSVHHGWQELCGPLVATRSVGNVVAELNWRSAFEIYRAHVLEDAGAQAGAEDFWALSRRYPLGIQRRDAEVVVRDPVATDGAGGLVCVGDVPENAVLSVLKGAPESLIRAARAAAEEAAADGDPRTVCHCLLADCVSRVGFLGERFQEELDAIEVGLGHEGARPPLCGVLTLGEISSRGDQYLEFFNKTCVVAVLHEHA